MRRLRTVLACILLAVSTVAEGGIAYKTYRLVCSVTDVVNSIPGKLDSIKGEVSAAANSLTDLADARSAEALRIVDARTGQAINVIGDTAGETLGRVDKITALAQRELGAANQSIGTLADASTAAASLLRDADKAVTDIHPQALGLVAATKVVMGETAQTMRSVKDATPEVAAAVVEISKDAKREADELTKPKTTRQKLFEWLGMIPRIVKFVL